MARVLGMDAIRKEFKKETWVKRPHGKRYPKFKKKVEEYVEGEMRNEHGGIIDRAKTSLRQFTAIILMYLTLVRDFVTESIRRDYTERRRLLEQADADGAVGGGDTTAGDGYESSRSGQHDMGLCGLR